MNARSKTQVILGGTVVTVVILLALISLVWTPFNPIEVFPAERLEGPSVRHLLGTDRYGRDVFSQIMAGSRITLVVGLIAAGIGAVIGVPLGIIAGMRRGWVDQLIVRGADVLLAFPALLMAIIAGAMVGTSTTSAMVAIGIASIPAFIRVTRAGTVRTMSLAYIEAAQLAGRRGWGIATRHVLPNLWGTIIVQVSITFALAILAEAALSFLGLGTPPPEPSWGRMLQSAQTLLGTDPLLAVWPGAAIAITVLGFNVLGDGLRDMLDPTQGDRS